MYFDGLSYRRVAENMGEHFDHPTNPSTVFRWVQGYSKRASDVAKDFKLQTGPEWVADELEVKVGGKRYWIFNVMDSKTRTILAAYLSPEHTTKAAATALSLARERTANAPAVIKTDGLPAYVRGVDMAFPTNPVKHVVSQGIHAEINNNLSERLQGTLRDRDKTLRSMKTRETGQAYIDGLVMNYNYFRPHGGLGGKTPAASAGADIPFKSWSEVGSLRTGPPTTSTPVSVVATVSPNAPRRRPTPRTPKAFSQLQQIAKERLSKIRNAVKNGRSVRFYEPYQYPGGRALRVIRTMADVDDLMIDNAGMSIKGQRIPLNVKIIDTAGASLGDQDRPKYDLGSELTDDVASTIVSAWEKEGYSPRIDKSNVSEARYIKVDDPETGGEVELRVAGHSTQVGIGAWKDRRPDSGERLRVGYGKMAPGDDRFSYRYEIRLGDSAERTARIFKAASKRLANMEVHSPRGGKE